MKRKRLLENIRDRHTEVFKILLFAVTVAVIVWILPKEGKFKYEFQVGKTWLNQDFIAPFGFAINKSKEDLKIEKNKITENFKPYFKLDTSSAGKEIKRYLKDFDLKYPKPKSKNDLAKLARTKQFGLEVISIIYSKGIVQLNEVIEKKPGDFQINLVVNNQLEERNLGDLFTIQTAFNAIQDLVNNHKENIEKQLLIDVIENTISQNVFYNEEMTKKALNEQLNNVSLTRGMVKQGELIIAKGEVIDRNKYQILESLKNEYIVQLGSKTNYYFILTGQIVLISICISLLFLFLTLFRRDIIADNNNATFILLLIVLNVFMTAGALRFDSVVSIYILPYCILPVMMRVFFDTRTALFTHLVTCLILGFIVPNSFEFILIELIGGIITIFSIVTLRNRSQLFMSVAFIFFTYALTYLSITIIQQGKIDNIEWEYFGWFAISAMITLFAYPMIYVFEKLFGFISDVSLLELADTNSPLLRELATKAPGTFQHSLQVANLAEEAIQAIGGSPLLVRTGALYHDIGKLDSPMYFIENQTTGINPHDEIGYEESAAIITGHVIGGIERAKKNNIPDRIIDFIRTHHGTTKVQYFYQSYLKIHPNEIIDESMFQYPGPIPFSKETAVLMMADSVEAASRSLKRYDVENIDALVEKIIDYQIKENQFINSDITFKNINTIKKIFKKKLLNIYHLRMEYPNK